MPRQAPLRLLKRCRLYLPRGEWKIPHITRGIYVLYQKKPRRCKEKVYEVFYIGVGGVSKNAKSGVGARIRSHDKTKKDGWTHYSCLALDFGDTGDHSGQLVAGDRRRPVTA